MSDMLQNIRTGTSNARYAVMAPVLDHYREFERRFDLRLSTLYNMSEMSMPVISDQPLRILHAVRAPVGGIIRHILDLANGQAERGHHVGLITDSLTGGERASAALAEVERLMAGGGAAVQR